MNKKVVGKGQSVVAKPRQWPLTVEEIRDPVNNNFNTQSLFWEYHTNKGKAVFTLKDDDYIVEGKVYYSLKKLFLQCTDPTGYEFATEILGSWKLYQRLLNNKLLTAHFLDWQEELEVKIRSQSLRSLIKVAKNDGAKGVTAAKYVTDKAWDKTHVRTKEAKQKRAKQDAALTNEVEEDLKRLGLH